MLIQTFVEPPLDNNNYVVLDDAGKEAVLIDCSAEDDAIMNFIKEHGATLKYVLITHGHLDHIMGVRYFQKTYGARVYVSRADRPLMAKINEWTAWLGWSPVPVPDADGVLEEVSDLRLGEEKIHLIPTPGHTPGGVSFLIGNHLFSGDTLFRGTHGRVDLPGSSADAMQASLKTLCALPDETQVHPGHGASTTIGAEKTHYSP